LKYRFDKGFSRRRFGRKRREAQGAGACQHGGMTIDIETRMAALDWARLAEALHKQGWAQVRGLLDAAACREAAAMFDAPEGFRSHVVMQRHGFGQGEYRYFAYPLPPLVAALRTGLYARLAPLANDWQAQMGGAGAFPEAHADFVARCHAAGQRRPTPLILRYGPGDYNRLHQDVYGPLVFPIQAVILLSAPETDFAGGELVLTEQRPRMQSRAQVVPLRQGDMALFAVNSRPVTGTRGTYRVTMRHGVSTLREGARHTLGIIFHDAP
jgi:hypothetical protein